MLGTSLIDMFNRGKQEGGNAMLVKVLGLLRSKKNSYEDEMFRYATDLADWLEEKLKEEE